MLLNGKKIYDYITYMKHLQNHVNTVLVMKYEHHKKSLVKHNKN